MISYTRSISPKIDVVLHSSAYCPLGCQRSQENSRISFGCSEERAIMHACPSTTKNIQLVVTDASASCVLLGEYDEWR